MIELILVMGILATLYGISSISLSQLIPKTSVSSASEVFRSELRLLQAKAMGSDLGLDDTASAFGVYIDTDRYVFFEGDTYQADAPTNVVTVLDEVTTLSSTLPQSSLVFQRGSGEVLNYTMGQDTVTFINAGAGETAQLRVNRFGVTLDVE